MIFDLATTDAPVKLEADVGLIGGGTVGLVIADRLISSGLRVVVLESGSRQETERSRALNEIECTGQVYRGATAGRTRGLGGTSQIWGGALIPFLPVDFAGRPEIGLQAWPINDATLQPYIGQIEQLFRVVPGHYEKGADVPPATKGNAFVPRLAKWPHFSRRNVASLLAGRLEGQSGPEIWLNSTVVDYRISDDGISLAATIAAADGGKTLELSAKKFVVCAGAIESTRLMLWLQRQTERPERFSSCLGRYFHDHLSKVVAHLDTPDQAHVNRVFGFNFEKRTMRSLRYEVSPELRRTHRLPGGFCHISFQPVADSSIENIRAILRGIQSRKLSWRQVIGLSSNIPYLTRMAYWLAIRRQLYWPVPSILSLHVVAEQMPRAANAVRLSTRCDRFGVPLASLAWSVDDKDLRVIGTISKHFSRFWADGPLSDLGCLVPLETAEAEERQGQSVDIYHPGGSTRMSSNANAAIVDGDLRVWGMPNLFIASTSTFPTGGAANPTMTLLLLGLRLADRIKTDLLGRAPSLTTSRF